MNKKSIILLSGGLDSLASLSVCFDNYKISLALTFDYGQKSAFREIEAAKKICEYYKLEHKIIKLDWLKEITKTSLVSEKDFPTPTLKDLRDEEFTQNSAKSVWVPNRNGLFLNIAGSFADAFGYDQIIFGANLEEGQTFSDNTQEFIDSINREFEFSTQNHPKIIAPLINSDKNDIVKIALENNAPLELTRSCYSSEEKNCGVCESCVRLKRALEANECEKLINLLF